MSADTPRRLGRGLEALISTARQQREPGAADDVRARPDLLRLSIADIRPNPFQPRRTFTPDEGRDLEASLATNGLLQPITVRRRARSEGYELVAGERRLRAATRLGWTDIPALIRDFDDRAMLTLALVENLQRADLNPVEEAEGYQRLVDDFGLTQQQVADAVGKDRTTITNLLRVLSLPGAVLGLVVGGQLSAGHARALLMLKDERQQVALANEAVAGQLSVRETERRAREAGTTTTAPRPSSAVTEARVAAPTTPASADPATRRAEAVLRKRLQTDVQIQSTGNERGVVRISFYSHDDLDRLLELVAGVQSDFD
jgi:ParB family chromosome partitioning protein